MNNTYKLFSTLTTETLQNMNLEQLAVAYIEDLNPSILATAFCKLFNLTVSTSSNYFGLDDSDIASFSVEELDKCLQVYDVSKGAFSTLYTTYLKNRLRMETEALNAHKRKASLYSESYENIVEVSGVEFESTPFTDPNTEIDEALKLLHSLGLTDKELKYCQLLMYDFKNSEIADIFDVSVMTLSNMRKKIRQKISPEALYCY